jgi:hypothetical protein
MINSGARPRRESAVRWSAATTLGSSGIRTRDGDAAESWRGVDRSAQRASGAQGDDVDPAVRSHAAATPKQALDSRVSTCPFKSPFELRHRTVRGVQPNGSTCMLSMYELARLACSRRTHHRCCRRHRHQTEGNAARRAHESDGSGTRGARGACPHSCLPRVPSTLGWLNHCRQPAVRSAA